MRLAAFVGCLPSIVSVCLLSKEVFMLYWAAVFLVISIIAGLLGFGGIAGTAAEIAKILFGIFLVLFIVFVIIGWSAGRAIT
jgi:uncharacterized membrane protein YtjA (UPF0391 family)